MASSYEHKQKGGWTFYFMLGISVLTVVILLVVTAMVPPETEDYEYGIAFIVVTGIFTCGLLGWATLLMSSMTVKIEGDFLVLLLGRVAFRKRFRLKDIVSCRVVRNSALDGWGIHKCKGGWIYNVAGREAVEITMASGKVNRIGTDEPGRLVTAIRSSVEC